MGPNSLMVVYVDPLGYIDIETPIIRVNVHVEHTAGITMSQRKNAGIVFRVNRYHEWFPLDSSSMSTIPGPCRKFEFRYLATASSKEIHNPFVWGKVCVLQLWCR